MLAVTGNDIEKLNDKDLRTLIGLLCEEELERYNISRKGVTWGGDQNARDDGVDVRVQVSSEVNQDSFVPAENTIFQVKATDMPASEIEKEMSPKGKLRSTIRKLSDDNGAYVIVSSKGSVAEFALKNRLKAINSVLLDYKRDHNIKYDFYDRNRIASWVRSYPALIFWIRDKNSDEINGWQGYDNWLNFSNEKYIVDEDARLFNNTRSNSTKLSIIDGINIIRTKMKEPGTSIRLVGLSGVGKTSLVKALFNDEIGKNILQKTKVIYADYSDQPIPAPVNFIQQLIALNKQIHLILDNCPPEVHRKLTKLCSTKNSLISILTVEYDIREDQPEETDVFYLDVASNELIENMIINQHETLNRAEARRVAEFSGGNARIAKSLANTLNQEDNISDLKDDVLFDRLFKQRNEKNTRLREAAEILSLVYSFNKKVDLENKELNILSKLTGLNSLDLYKYSSELKERGLLQERGDWRAVLPHAIGNRLAKRALKNLPENILCSTIAESERLFKSFSRRLSYLSDSEKAKNIAYDLLNKDGYLADINNLDKNQVEILKNITPIIPEKILLKMEELIDSEENKTFFTRENNYFYEYAKILIYIAYEVEYFNRAVKLLILFSLSEKENNNYNSVRKLLYSLFHIQLSGTNASIEQRLSIIRELMESESRPKIDLGIKLFKESIKSSHFIYHFSFRPVLNNRDYGYYPKTKDEFELWYIKLLDFSAEIIKLNNYSSEKIKEILGDEFRSLWSRTKLYDELENLTKLIRKNGFWINGINSINRTLNYDTDKMSNGVVERLKELKNILEPNNLIEKLKLFLFSSRGFDLFDDPKVVNDKSKKLGVKAANNIDILKQLLPEILFGRAINLYNFGQGLAQGSHKPERLWQIFRNEIEKKNALNCNFNLLKGFLNELSKIDFQLTNKIMDQTLEDKVLAKIFPNLQLSYALDDNGFVRLKKSLELGIAPVSEYSNLAYNYRINDNDENFAEIIEMILNDDNEIRIAIQILHQILNFNKDNEISDVLINTAHEVLFAYSFENKNDRGLDFQLSEIIKKTLDSDNGKKISKIILARLKVNCNSLKISMYDYSQVMNSLAQTQPITFLDQVIGYDKEKDRIDYTWKNSIVHQSNPLNQIDNQTIIHWCEEKRSIRYLKIIDFINIFKTVENSKELRLSELINLIINNAPNKIEVLEEISKYIRPMSWSGSRYLIIEKRVNAILKLKNNQDTNIVNWIKNKEIEFKKIIEIEKHAEQKEDLIYQSFE